jgi:ribosome maturation factor RimP
MKNEEIIEKISTEITTEISSMGLDLIEVSFVRGILRLTIDKPEGVSLDDCVLVTRQVGLMLDALEVIEGKYKLEVSSPGLNRKLVTLKDFEHFKGRKLKVQTSQQIIKGTLIGTDGLSIIIDTGEIQESINLTEIVKANLDY